MVRNSEDKDIEQILKVISSAFEENESEIIKKLVTDLSREKCFPLVRSLVFEQDREVIGYISFSPIYMESNNVSGYLLAPLAVSPKYQKKGIGRNLINTGIKILIKDNVDVLLVYGDPAYYKRFGFNEEIGKKFIPPFSLEYPFGWLGLSINDTNIPKQSNKFKCVEAFNKKELW